MVAPEPLSPFDALMAAAVDAIIIIDSLGRVERFNPAAEALFGFAAVEVVGNNVSMLMPTPHRERHDDYIRRYLDTGQAAIIGVGREVSGRHRDGSTFPMLLSVGEYHQGGQQHFVGIIRDLTEIRRAQQDKRELEEKLLHADRLVILGELTGGIAHEINQPLTAIAAYADAGRSLVDRMSLDDGADMYSICERIAGQARRAGEVVQRLRGLVRSGTATKGRHDLNEIIKNVLLLFDFELQKTNVDLDFQPLEGLEALYVDDIQIQQVLANLVKNSLDALAESGQDDGRIEIRVRRAASDVLISVTDNGPGVPPDLRSSLFESFFTTKPKGVGLGLSICRNIASAHGGSLRHTEPPEGGCRFTLALPLSFIG